MLALWHLASGLGSIEYPDDVANLPGCLDALPSKCAGSRSSAIRWRPARPTPPMGGPESAPSGELAWQSRWPGRRTRSSPTLTVPPPILVRYGTVRLYSPAAILIDERAGMHRQRCESRRRAARRRLHPVHLCSRHSPKRPRPQGNPGGHLSIPASYDNRPDSSTSGDDVSDEEVGGGARP